MIKPLSLFFFLLFTILHGKPLSIQIDAPYAILMDADTKEVLFEKNAHASVFPASTTKTVTALYLLRNHGAKLEEMVRCPAEALIRTTEAEKLASNFTLPAHLLEVDGVMMGLRAGESLLLKELLAAMMITSSNDVANVLAYYTEGKMETFMEKVNSMVQELGCKKTHFCNPHGLYHPEHVTTAYDMALLTSFALEYPLFRDIVKAPSYIRKSSGREYRQGNALVRADNKFYYPKAIGVKTGWTKKAKMNLIAAASNGERNLIGVVHHLPSRSQTYRDMTKMFEVAFQEKKEKRILFKALEAKYEKKVARAKQKLVGILEEDLFLEYFPSEEPKGLKAHLIWQDASLPIEKHQVVGELEVLDSRGRLLLKAPLFAEKKIEKKWIFVGGEALFSWITSLKVWGILLLTALLYFLMQQKKLFRR